jgi:transposase
MSCLVEALDPATVIATIDPGKAFNRVWVSDGSGLLEEPGSLPVSRAGIEALERALGRHAGMGPVIGIEATGGLHQAWAAELERLHPGAVRVFAPSETKAAREQLGWRKLKSDDRDCAALTYLVRQGGGRHPGAVSAVDALRAAVRHRRGLVSDQKVAAQRLHDQLNMMCPGLSAPASQGRALALDTSTGRAVMACVVAFAGRAPSVRSLMARADTAMSRSTAQYWVDRWRACLPPPDDAQARAQRIAGDLKRYQLLGVDIAARDAELVGLLGATEGQVLTSLPGVAVIRASAFAAFSLPISRFPDAEHLYSATGLAPAIYQSSTVSRRGAITRQGLAEHRDALMGIAHGLGQYSPSFQQRNTELRKRGMAPMQARVALSRHACRLCYRMLVTQQPFDEQAYRRARRSSGR